jgi:hypothetical protein
VVIAKWNGGLIAREVKAMVPSACAWLEGRIGHRQSFYERAIAGAVRSHDPFQTIRGEWDEKTLLRKNVRAIAELDATPGCCPPEVQAAAMRESVARRGTQDTPTALVDGLDVG